ncbi:Uma2 family endonuclease [Oscillatoria salina]|uniref:Uma2 family endonuclease n=1 Tax=Oscillatoria salina TaxID=331517 RepID=UPI0013B62934|nr:Uma2 family endonuclease [Oscillatoria salina]MBZ8180804.1 Uma2 family endonuclease [Oscillatoria salina IIICB1]NET88837.1 Uma2 family endonuclease [Kamptonema sp. SIO1D9]
MLPTITPDKIDLPAGTRLQFPGTIADYEQLLERLGDRAIPRLRFRDNHILLMSPLPEHGKEIDVIVDLVKALLRHQDRDWDSFHPITLRYGKEPGLEPDACFYIENYQAILGKRKLDMSIDPPPDLAIEIDVTSFTRIEDYISLAIPEVWIYKANELHIYRFTDNSYVETDTSLIFLDFSVKEIVTQYVDRAWQVGSSVALREFSQTLQSRENK